MTDATKLIEAGIVTLKIAESLVQLPDTPPLLVAIYKKIPQAEPNHYHQEDLTDDDVLLLRSIWADLPIPAAWNMTREQFAMCKTVFEAAPNKPGWEIQEWFRDDQREAKSERGHVAIKHMRQIEAKVKQGHFEIFTNQRILTDKVGPGTLMRIADARSYLKALGLDTSWLSAIEAALTPTPKLEAVTVTTPAPAVQHNEADYDEKLAALFDPVTVEALEKTFPSNGRWKNWAERANRNGLKDGAKTGRGLFNPYNAAVWFVNQNIVGWDLARCYRVLETNLPARSRDDAHLLTGGID